MVHKRKSTIIRKKQIIDAARKIIIRKGSEHLTLRAMAQEVLMIGAIEPLRDRRNEATGGSPKSSHSVIVEIEPVDDHRNRASW